MAVVLDSSALLALILREPGHENVTPLLPGALISTVNLAEIISRLARTGWDTSIPLGIISRSAMSIVDLDRDQAVVTGRLVLSTMAYGLSLGDRACLALAQARGLGVLTADRAWSRLPDMGIPIEMIR